MYNYYIKDKEKEKLNYFLFTPSFDRKVVKLNGSNYSTVQ